MRGVKGKGVEGIPKRVIEGRNMSTDLKRHLRNSILLPVLTYVSQTLTRNREEQSRVHAVEIRYLGGVYRVTRRDSESNESIYER